MLGVDLVRWFDPLRVELKIILHYAINLRLITNLYQHHLKKSLQNSLLIAQNL